MPLDERQLEKLKTWFESKNVNWSCVSCGHNMWSAGDIVVAPRFKHGVVLGGPAIPMVQVICQNCSHVRLYAAIPMGLLEEERAEPAKGTETEEKRRRLR